MAKYDEKVDPSEADKWSGPPKEIYDSRVQGYIIIKDGDWLLGGYDRRLMVVKDNIFNKKFKKTT